MALVVTAQLLPAPAPAVAALADGPGRLVLRASFRSTDPEAASVLSADLPATLRELFVGEHPPFNSVPVLYQSADLDLLGASFPGSEVEVLIGTTKDRDRQLPEEVRRAHW